MSAPTFPSDVSLNRSNISRAKSQRLLASWLPVGDSFRDRSESEIEQEEEKIIETSTELSGFGMTTDPADDDDLKRKNTALDEKLKERLLGKGYKRSSAKSKERNHAALPTPVTAKPRAEPMKKEALEESEEEGRSTLGKKRKRIPPIVEDEEAENAVVDDVEDQQTSQPSKKAYNYLDEVLQAKASKKKKKKKKKTKAKD